jgi:hypothetical protein
MIPCQHLQSFQDIEKFGVGADGGPSAGLQQQQQQQQDQVVAAAGVGDDLARRCTWLCSLQGIQHTTYKALDSGLATDEVLIQP